MLTIARRFNGPPDSANGGYACGLLAARAAPVLGTAVAVTLHAPPRLDVALEPRPAGRRVHLWDGGELVATASPSNHRVVPPAPVRLPDAAAAAQRFPGRVSHPFPSCFVCGTTRQAPGLFLAPGPVAGRADTVACPWIPERPPAPEVVWAVLDCPCGWTCGPVTRTTVLSWMYAEVLELPAAGQPCVVVARLDGRQGRAITNTSALHDAGGRLLAMATTRWLPLP